MALERTADGLQARLKIRGLTRFPGAVFLVVWLAGWAAGEGFALWILFKGASALFSGQSPEPGRHALELGPALVAGLFLLFWLSFWTLGGWLASRELLRLLFGRDRILVTATDLQVEHRCGIFCSQETAPRTEIVRFYCKPASAALCVETKGRTQELTRLGTPAERAELEQALNSEFGVATAAPAQGALPANWSEIVSLERDPVLVKDRGARSKQATAAWILSGALASIALYVLYMSQRGLSLLSSATKLLIFAGLIALGAFWLRCSHNEWRLDKGRLVLQRRFRQKRTVKFEAVALELYEDNSGDGGPYYQLVAVAAGASSRTGSSLLGPYRKMIFSAPSDPLGPRKFGRWLSERCQLPLTDETTPEATAIQLEELKRQLAASGWFGRAVLRIIEKLGPPQRRPDV